MRRVCAQQGDVARQARPLGTPVGQIHTEFARLHELTSARDLDGGSWHHATFTLFAAKADDLPDAYARYLINGIRERFDLQGTPIRLNLRRTDNPFHDKE